MTPRASLLLLPLLGPLAACASGAPTPAPVATAAALPPIPYCRDEMAAYIELSRFARAHGEGWTVFAPAIDALQQRVVACVDDAAQRFRLLRLDPRQPAPPPARQCTTGCMTLRSAGQGAAAPTG